MDRFFHYQLYNRINPSFEMINEKKNSRKTALTSMVEVFFVVVIARCNFTPEFKPHNVSQIMFPQHCSYYSDNKRASVMFYKIGYIFLICQ